MRLAIISDIHEDIYALERILTKVEKAGYDQLVCLGDVSGFSVPHYKYEKERNAHDCLALLREKQSIIVPGNHDCFAARMVPKHSDIFSFPANWYNLEHEYQNELTGGEIWLHEDELEANYTSEDLAYLRSLDEYYVFKESGTGVLFSHYIYPNLSGFKKGFYTRAEEFKAHFELMDTLGCSLSFSGHAHIWGFYSVKEGRFRHHAYTNLKLKTRPVCIGVPPVTTNNKKSGFCIFDVDKSNLRVIRS